MRLWLGRIALALTASLVALEIGLQLLSLGARLVPALRGEAAADGDALRILCIGDSHTFGAGVARLESYPAQLSHQLDIRSPGDYEVLNLGVPGANSSFVASRFDAQLARYRPDLAIIWIGLNNIWNRGEVEQSGAHPMTERIDAAMLRVKLYRLVKVMLHQERIERDEAPVRSGPIARRKADRATARDQLQRDLDDVLHSAEARNVPVVLLTYPRRSANDLNQIISEAGRKTGVPVVHTAPILRRALAAGHDSQALFVRAVGPHPSPMLYEMIADALLPTVNTQLPNHPAP